MRKTLGSKTIVYVMVGIVTVLGAGCIVPSQQAVKTGGSSPENGASLQPRPQGSPQGLIKPTIPEEPRPAAQTPLATQSLAPEPSSAGAETPPDNPAPPSEPKKEEPVPRSVGPESQLETMRPESRSVVAQNAKTPKLSVESAAAKKPEKREWEDHKVREAALKMAEGFPQVSRLKVCYAVKDDEWWVTFYDNAGAFTELKQYTWNRELEKLEAFLVLKRILSSRVQQHLTEEEVGKACEALEVPKTGASQ